MIVTYKSERADRIPAPRATCSGNGLLRTRHSFSQPQIPDRLGVRHRRFYNRDHQRCRRQFRSILRRHGIVSPFALGHAQSSPRHGRMKQGRRWRIRTKAPRLLTANTEAQSKKNDARAEAARGSTASRRFLDEQVATHRPSVPLGATLGQEIAFVAAQQGLPRAPSRGTTHPPERPQTCFSLSRCWMAEPAHPPQTDHKEPHVARHPFDHR